jgi:predicted nuclease with RNAse H fold
MRTAGVDVSSQDAGTAACVIDWFGQSAFVREVTVRVGDAAIMELLMTVDKVGIDAPLGWPIAFADAVTQHSRGDSWPSDYLHSDNLAYRYRRTDLHLWDALKSSPPLSVSIDKIAYPAMRVAAVMSRLPNRMALDGTGVVVEVYPAAALRRWGFASRKYKGKDNLVNRRELVADFLQNTSQWLDVGVDDVDRCFASDDAFDAMIAALVARASATSLVDGIPEEDRVAARREGWIAIPTEGSLSLLAGGRPP